MVPRSLAALALGVLASSSPLLAAQEPAGAIVMDRAWNLLRSNATSTRLTQLCCRDLDAVLEDGPPNVLRLLFHPAGMREAVREMKRLMREARGLTLVEST